MVRSWFVSAATQLCFFVFWAVLAVDTRAQEPSVTSGEPSAWVRVQAYNAQSLDGKPTSGPAYVLISRQRFHENDDEHYYSRFVAKINDISSAEDASQLSISFDPSYERMVFHHITVVRDGVRQDRLDMKAVNIFQKEDDAERLIFNGSVTASVILRDIRPGDILDYAYTISGKNPVFFGHIADRVRLNYGVPVGKYYASFDVPEDRSYQVAGYGGAPQPTQSVEGGRRRFVWDREDIAGLRVDDNVPAWHRSFALFEITDQTDWAEMGQLYTPYYRVPDRLSAALRAEIDKIASENSSVEGQVRAALSFVQSNIRYLGIESGKGGYAPRNPSLVLDQRFGDCKDKTILLVTILNQLGVQAKPLLVDTEIHAQFRRELPSAYAFDHVITHVSLGDKVLWLDPTRDDQIGDLAHLEQANFGAGLLVDGADSGIIEFQGQQTPPSVRVVETFDVVKETGTVFLAVNSTYWGNRADRIARQLKDEGVNGVQANYLEYYQANYPTIVAVNPLNYERDEAAGTITVAENYRIPDAWDIDEDDGSKRFPAWPSEVSSALPEADLVPRTSPLDLPWPTNVHHELRFIVDDGWSFNDEDISLDNSVFAYSKVSRFEGSVFSEKYTYRGKKDFATVEELTQFNVDAKRADDEDGIRLYQPGPAGAEADDATDTLTMIILSLLVIVVAVSLVVTFIKAIKVDSDWRTDAVFYPISVAKFLLLSIGTLGAYSFFWSFKNWQWVRDVEGERVSPFWRAFFQVFTNFVLFSNIALHPDSKSKILERSFIWLAALILVAEFISNLADRVEALPDILFLAGLVSIPATLPFVRQIAQLNQNSCGVLERNSSFTWHSGVALTFGVCFWLLVIAGMMVD